MHIRILSMLFMAIATLCAPQRGAMAQDFSGLARLNVEASSVKDTRDGVALELTLSQGVPYRVFTLDSPERLVLDFREIDWSGVDPTALDQSDSIGAIRVGEFQPGWSRMVVDLGGPYLLREADMAVEAQTGIARLNVLLNRGDAESFAAASGAPDGAIWEINPVEIISAPEDRFVIVLDPGHGGIDPGADQGGVLEKDLMLTFALELKEVLLRSGDVDVILTREDDRFVSLDRRVAIAHQAQADIFLSLHADALSEGQAHGATVYTLSETASDKASAALAERHERTDILSGIDLSTHDDVVADVLIDLARQETQPRTENLAEAMRKGIKARNLDLNTRPLRSAGFSVLKSPDIPSVLLELGFLSSERDRENIKRPQWRAAMAEGIRDAIFTWRQSDAAASDLVRQ
jgi:N-acetylmuramoyl-L-alanine amidase